MRPHIRPRDEPRAVNLRERLVKFSDDIMPLRGITTAQRLDCLVAQMIDSLRRIQYAKHLVKYPAGLSVRDPSYQEFDPFKAAVLYSKTGNISEAWWLVFLATHFGKHEHDGWRLMRDIYGRLGDGKLWDWPTISQNPKLFRGWLHANVTRLRSDGVSRRFSNHRKYESLMPPRGRGTADAVESYVDWIGALQSPWDLITAGHKEVGQNPQALFRWLYDGMRPVQRFGRLAKFDFLTMIGKLELAPIDPDSAYIDGATGPRRGAGLLFENSTLTKTHALVLQTWLDRLDGSLQIGMQAMEDSLCNWQKSPDEYQYFKG